MDQLTEITLKGLKVSPGICVGKAYLIDNEGVDVVEKYIIPVQDLQHEIQRFKNAIKKTREELRLLIKNTPEALKQHAYIVESHMMLLRDKNLYDKIIETCKKEQINAEWAVKKVTSNLTTIFQNITDPYLNARAVDIGHVSDRIIRNLLGAKPLDITKINKRVILVAHDLSPAETSQIQLEKIMGLVTDRGGKTSHTGIIARTLGIPAVLGLENASKIIKNDDLIIVDGSSGTVIVHPEEETLIRFHERQESFEKYQAGITRESHQKAQTMDGIDLQIMGNIELPEEVVSVLAHGGDGIGLYRTEFQYLSRPFFPNENELFDKYQEVVEVMAPKPVTIRTLDINGDKAVAFGNDSNETNPVLGLRAIRYCLKKQDVFKIQLRAILRAAAFGNVRILFPMISNYDEIIDAKRLLDEAADSLDKEGAIFTRDIEIGMMIEVPSAVVMADIMANEVDFFSIGTNDLIQYSLAIDRGNKDVAYLYNPLNPAILRMLKHVTNVARDKGIKIFMCGEMASDPINIPILLGLGMDELSMSPQSMPAVKSMVRALNIEDSKLFLKEALTKATALEVAQLLEETYGNLVSDKTYK
ncbi:MAG: phosphoenolpyruvate--protein phosphotransferase [Deltaproteobacteria bacterium]|nr:phosphoenolpyruvate--protein phosphotransferase [Deltaproteobacteria bacterium]